MEFHGNATIPLEEARGSLDKFVEEKGTCVEKGDIVILGKRISMGMGDKNPVEKMVYFDKGKNRRILSSEQLRQNLPRHLTKETYFVILRKDDEESLNNAKIICREWVGKVKEDGDKKVKEDGDGASLIDVSLYD